MSNPFHIPFEAIRQNLATVLPTLSARAGAMVVEHSNEAFRDQGWTDSALDPWGPRDPDKSPGRAILVKTGRLRRSIRIVNVTADSVSIGSDVPYAKVHNEGYSGSVNVSSFNRNRYGKTQVASVKTHRLRTITGIASTHQVGAHTKTMRIIQRRFLGNSHQQTEKIKSMIYREIGKAFKTIR